MAQNRVQFQAGLSLRTTQRTPRFQKIPTPGRRRQHGTPILYQFSDRTTQDSLFFGMQPSWFSAVDEPGAVAVVRLSAAMGRGRLNLPVCFTVFRGAVQRRLATREPAQRPSCGF